MFYGPKTPALPTVTEFGKTKHEDAHGYEKAKSFSLGYANDATLITLTDEVSLFKSAVFTTPKSAHELWSDSLHSTELHSAHVWFVLAAVHVKQDEIAANCASIPSHSVSGVNSR